MLTPVKGDGALAIDDGPQGRRQAFDREGTMPAEGKAETAHRTVDWMRWLHDPEHWKHFYDELATKTFASIAKHMYDGRAPGVAADLAIEEVSNKMREEGVPEDVVASYRQDYLRHRRQLLEVASEIGDAVPAPERGRGRRPGVWFR
jgi:hypothetical protein